MAEANGTPIRLVKDNKELIELEATSIALTVERDVDVTPLAATGGRRYAIDLNRNRSIIAIEGVFTDDRKTSDATAATALIDFSSYYDFRLSRNVLAFLVLIPMDPQMFSTVSVPPACRNESISLI